MDKNEQRILTLEAEIAVLREAVSRLIASHPNQKDVIHGLTTALQGGQQFGTNEPWTPMGVLARWQRAGYLI